MCDKADWGVLAKQFLQNKPLLPKLARESLKCCELLQRGTQAKETISGEARSEETTLETLHFCLCQEYFIEYFMLISQKGDVLSC